MLFEDEFQRKFAESAEIFQAKRHDWSLFAKLQLKNPIEIIASNNMIVVTALALWWSATWNACVWFQNAFTLVDRPPSFENRRWIDCEAQLFWPLVNIEGFFSGPIGIANRRRSRGRRQTEAIEGPSSVKVSVSQMAWPLTSTGSAYAGQMQVISNNSIYIWGFNMLKCNYT